jgi:hypothetical protein
VAKDAPESKDLSYDDLVAQVRVLRQRITDLERELYANGKIYGFDVTKALKNNLTTNC